jgi:hemoglobin
MVSDVTAPTPPRASPEAAPSARRPTPTEICTEREVCALVEGFYARVRNDPVLGPIFAEHVQDWDVHMPKMIDFWSAALRRTARYRGMPMPVHNALPGLDGDLFARWIRLFRATTAAQGNAALRLRANDLAERIARSLWYGYQLHRRPGQPPRELVLCEEAAPT